MASAEEIKDALSQAAVDGVKHIKGDEGEVEVMPIDDQIKAARFVADSAAADKPARGLRYTKFGLPGAV